MGRPFLFSMNDCWQTKAFSRFFYLRQRMKKYDLHKHDYTKLHFELKDMAPFFDRNREKAAVPHRHSFFQILWFKTSGQHYVDYEVIDHSANTLVLINQNQVHHFCPHSANEGYVFHFNASFIATVNVELLARFAVSIFNEIGNSLMELDATQVLIFEAQVQRILTELEQEDDNHAEVIRHQFISLLYQIERLQKAESAFSLDTRSDFSIVIRFRQLIVDQIDQPMRVQDFAEQLNVTAKKLSALTKHFTGDTPAQLIKDLKILEAKRRLSSRRKSIKEIAYDLGFDQPTYFTKFFKKATQITPKQFQESLR